MRIGVSRFLSTRIRTLQTQPVPALLFNRSFSLSWFSVNNLTRRPRTASDGIRYPLRFYPPREVHASVLRSTNKPATPRNRRPSSRASGWRPATPPLQPSPPARSTTPKSRFPGTSPCARDTDRSSWLRLSQGWYEMSINCSLTREMIYREKMASLADQNNWGLRKYFHGMLQVELNHQASLRSELKVITARLFGLHDWFCSLRPLDTFEAKWFSHKSLIWREEYERKNRRYFSRSWYQGTLLVLDDIY